MLKQQLEKNPLSNNAIKWINRNSLIYPNTKNYVRKLCKENFKFENYDFKSFGNEEYLILEQNDICYCISVDEEQRLLKLIKQTDIFGNMITLNVLEFNGEACWYECMKYIEYDSKEVQE